ncbi:hypothetical protein C6497_06560 [Candidatus Poribacteria bacterium]|nr:MAG: hypothetical protein C6497_06560 [Candidatus Poribacteria bacterium]
MNNRPFIFSILLIFFSSLIFIYPANSAPRNGTLRVSGDNTWVCFVNGEKVAENGNWQQPTVSEFTLDDGFAVIAVYVHDAEPGAAGRGGFLGDIILDDKPKYIGTGEEGWRCDTGKPIAQRNDGWEKTNFDDSDWEDELEVYEKFGGGIWGFGAGTMRGILKEPDCEAHWVWCGPNDQEDDIYFRYTIGTLPVEPKGKITTTWGSLKAAQ